MNSKTDASLVPVEVNGSPQDVLVSPSSSPTPSVGAGKEEAESELDSIPFIEDALAKVKERRSDSGELLRSATYAIWDSIKIEPFAEVSLEGDSARKRLQKYRVSEEYPSSRRHLAEDLYDLAHHFLNQFEFTDSLRDIHMAVSASHTAAVLLSDEDPEKAKFFSRLGDALQTRFERMERPADIEASIMANRQAVDLSPDDLPEKPKILSHLGVSLEWRFNSFGNAADIDQAIVVHRSSVALASDRNPDKPGLLSNLGNALESRFERFASISDIEEAISVKRQSVELLPADHPYKPASLNNLGNSLESRFERLGDPSDIQAAIDAKRQAVAIIADGNRWKPHLLTNLGGALELRFKRYGNIADIEEAIVTHRAAVALSPDDHSDKPGYLTNLANSLNARFERLGLTTDVEEALAAYRQSLDLTPDTYANKPGRLTNLGNTLELRFDRFGNIGDIDEAITLKRRSVSLTPDDHPDKPNRLEALGTAFDSRFMRFKDIKDCDEAIAAKRRAVELLPEDHPGKSGALSSLGTSLEYRFEVLGDLIDIENAVDSHRASLSLLPEGHPNKPGYLTNLGNALGRRSHKQDTLPDLEESILLKRQAVAIAPDDHPYKSTFLANLGVSLQNRFERFHNVVDVDEAIEMERLSVQRTSNNDISKTNRLTLLAISLDSRFELLKQPEDFEDALNIYMQAASLDVGPPLRRLRAIRRCTEMCWRNAHFATHSRMLDVYDCALSLIPLIAWLGDTLQRRYEELEDLSDLASAAAAVAIAAGELKLAVEWLEEGRGVVWGQILQLRSPFDNLRTEDIHLGARLQQISRALEHADNERADSVSLGTEAELRDMIEEKAVRRRRLAEERKDIIATIRKKPGFERFLLPRRLMDLELRLDGDPVVIINAHSSRCDALIVYSTDRVVLVPLPEFNYSMAEKMRTALTGVLHQANVRDRGSKFVERERLNTDSDRIIARTLEGLWKLVVKPVLGALEAMLYQSHTADRGFHITWCTTGPLSFLPLHAAAIYRDGASSQSSAQATGASKHVISSYTPTLTALSRQKPSTSSPQLHSKGVLIVSQPDTPGFNPLPGTTSEVMKIKSYFLADDVVHLNSAAATVKAVLDAMEVHHPRILHLACHGVQNRLQPMNSAFMLYDGPLQLSSLMTRTANNAELAFLSACQTATGDERLAEEAVHLAAGMLNVGFRSVIGTMWSIGDEDASLIADRVYRHLAKSRKAGAEDISIAGALYEAVQSLRMEVGERSFLRWVPYIHFGL